MAWLARIAQQLSWQVISGVQCLSCKFTRSLKQHVRVGSTHSFLAPFLISQAPASELMRAKPIAKSPCDELSSVRGAVAQSHPLSHLRALLAEFNLACEACLCTSGSNVFALCYSKNTGFSQRCWDPLVTLLLVFTGWSTISIVW